MNTDERFWAKVDRGSDDECWFWLGARAGGVSKGPGKYGRFNLSGKIVYAHRYSYELENGPIPEGLTIDHLCGISLCVNPGHLEAVSIGVNVRRGGNAIKTHCKRGHPFDDENTYISPRGLRSCRACQRRQT